MVEKPLYLYHVSQTATTGYDTFSDFVVACYSEEEARQTDPRGNYTWESDAWRRAKEDVSSYVASYWCNPDQVTVKLLGVANEAVKPGIICASFHAG